MLALVGSTFVPVGRFGLLLSIAIAATTAGALTVLPALLTVRFPARRPVSRGAASRSTASAAAATTASARTRPSGGP
jgi:hypothetical protein